MFKQIKTDKSKEKKIALFLFKKLTNSILLHGFFLHYIWGQMKKFFTQQTDSNSLGCMFVWVLIENVFNKTCKPNKKENSTNLKLYKSSLYRSFKLTKT